MPPTFLTIRGAAQNNLRDLDLDLPHGLLIGISGVSGSGKSSLVFDTIYVEARRRFLAALDQSQGGVTGRLRAPKVRRIEGLMPAAALSQQRQRRDPRATVATVARLHDYLRLLFARIGTPHCTACGAQVRWHRLEEVYDTAAGLPAGTQVTILAPRRAAAGETSADLIGWVERAGYQRVRVGGVVLPLEDVDPAGLVAGPLDVVVDRLEIKPGTARRLRGSLDAALEAGDGQVLLSPAGGAAELVFSVRPRCPDCGTAFPGLTPGLFSFNSAQGACPECRGTGALAGLDSAQVFAGGSASIAEALGPLWQDFGHVELYRQLVRFCDSSGVEMDAAVGSWPPEIAARLWQGLRRRGSFAGVRRWLERIGARAAGAELDWLDGFLGETPCPACRGRRLRPAALAVELAGLSIADVADMSARRAAEWLSALRFEAGAAAVGRAVVEQLRRELAALETLGVGHLALSRSADSVSSGELQRLRLGAALSCGLTHMLYVLDEPSAGLHAEDAERLLEALLRLRDAGNTVLMVEHDPSLLARVDLLVELGPGAGAEGGALTALGTPAQVAAGSGATAPWLRQMAALPRWPGRPVGPGGWLRLSGARGRNLRDIDVDIPLGNLVGVTGVSGSGKSTLVRDTLEPLVAARTQGAARRPLAYGGCLGLELLERVVGIDQSPIGRSARSNAATYTGLLTPVRRLFSELPEARMRAYTPAHFSSNLPEGACPQCGGRGGVASPGGLAGAAELACSACDGRRYRGEVLDVRYRGLDIAQILDLTVAAAAELFAAVPEVARRSAVLSEVGLGYLRLGQPATTLSGGEAQRLKLAAELGRPQGAHTLYILDEPTSGLHMRDVELLLRLLQKLVEAGNTVVVVEHHVPFIAACDWVIDLGPAGGSAGGRVVAAGRPAQVAAADSATGRCLRRLVEPDPAP